MKTTITLLALLLTGPAWATWNQPEPENGNEIEIDVHPHTDSDADADASSRSYGGDNDAEGGNARQHQGQGQSLDGSQDTVVSTDSANSNDSNAANASNVVANPTASASNLGSQGNASSYASNYSSRALAIDIPSATAAPAVEIDCITHTRGHTVLMGVWARTGSTSYDPQCVAAVENQQAHIQCLDLVSIYSQMGETDSAMAQLATCGGAGPSVSTVPSDAAIQRMFESIAEK